MRCDMLAYCLFIIVTAGLLLVRVHSDTSSLGNSDLFSYFMYIVFFFFLLIFTNVIYCHMKLINYKKNELIWD